MYFLRKEDITPKILYWLVLVLVPTRYPLLTIFGRDFSLNKGAFVDLASLSMLLEFPRQLTSLNRYLVIFRLRVERVISDRISGR